MMKLQLFVRGALVSVVLLLAVAANAQDKKTYTDAEYARKPLWIEMINDTAANYFEVERAYKLYFKKHELPEEEHDVIGERRERERQPGRGKQRKMQQENQMRREVKKYRHWREINLPYVQPDGSILGPAARLEIWKNNKAK